MKMTFAIAGSLWLILSASAGALGEEAAQRGGSISLQSENRPVEFRKVELRKLDE